MEIVMPDVNARWLLSDSLVTAGVVSSGLDMDLLQIPVVSMVPFPPGISPSYKILWDIRNSEDSHSYHSWEQQYDETEVEDLSDVGLYLRVLIMFPNWQWLHQELFMIEDVEIVIHRDAVPI